MIEVINDLGIGTALEITVITLICFGVNQLLKQTFSHDKWIPWYSALVGILAGVLVNYWQQDSLLSGSILGLLVGLAVSGLFKGFKQFFDDE